MREEKKEKNNFVFSFFSFIFFLFCEVMLKFSMILTEPMIFHITFTFLKMLSLLWSKINIIWFLNLET